MMMKEKSSHTRGKRNHSNRRTETTCEIQGHRQSYAMEMSRKEKARRSNEEIQQ
jgi:hypothetical protein